MKTKSDRHERRRMKRLGKLEKKLGKLKKRELKIRKKEEEKKAIANQAKQKLNRKESKKKMKKTIKENKIKQKVLNKKAKIKNKLNRKNMKKERKQNKKERKKKIKIKKGELKRLKAIYRQLKKEIKKEEKKMVLAITSPGMAKTEKKEESPEKKKERRKKLALSERAKLLYASVFSLVISTIVYFIFKNFIYALTVFAGIIILFKLWKFVSKNLQQSAKVRKMETVFPDFLQLVSSNLRAGMTIDRALILSARHEFSPLDEEILAVGKEILTGKELTVALEDMAKRINSDRINRTILLIIRGIKAGGNLSVLLEEIATNTREKSFVEKRASSNVVMYLIFIFFAIAVGAPVLFALSSILVQVLTNLLTGLPDTTGANINLPFALTQVNISLNFIIWYSVIFLVVIDILASLILGLVSKGEEKQGIKFMLPLIAISLTIFFLVRFILSGAMSGFIG